MTPLNNIKSIVRSSIDLIATFPGGHFFMAFLTSMRATLRHKKFILIYRKQGRWQHWEDGNVIVDLKPQLCSVPSICETATRDNWLTNYQPCQGDVIVDLGASVGDNALTLSKLVGPVGRVIAIEAHPATYKCLEETCRLNGLSNVIPVHVAVHDCEESVQISDLSENKSNAINSGEGGFSVPGTTLDKLMDTLGVGEISFIKINIEGAELPALKHAASVLSRTRHMVVSCHDFLAEQGGDEATRTFDEIRAILAGVGFSITLRLNDPRPYISYQVIGTYLGEVENGTANKAA